MNRPWMPLYIADYLADTSHLRALESGGYLHLIMHYWQHGGVPNDDRKLAAIARMTDREWKRHKSTISEFFDQQWRHKRIEAELAKAADISSKRSASAKQKHSNSPAIDPANAEQLDTHARASSPSPSQRKEDTADAVSSSDGEETPPSPAPNRYAFESGVIRLTDEDFNKWKLAYTHLDLAAELLALTEWASTQPKWYFAVSGALAKRNREAKAAAQRAQSEQSGFKWNGIEGVL